MEDQFSCAAIDAVFTGYPSIRGYNLPADVGTRGAYSLYPRLYSIRNDREFASAFPRISNTHWEVTALYTTYAWLGVINNGFKDLEKGIRRGTVNHELDEHVATWRTAVSHLFASTSASYDILLYQRRDKNFGK